MAVREILVAPDKRLKTVCEPIAEVDAEVRRLMDDLIETMHAAPGIGLAAPQIGVLKRVLVIDVHGEDEAPQPIAMANPEVAWASDEMATREEGCLSLPEHYAEVTRPARVRVAYVDRQGARRELEAEGLKAACVQHEIDHLDGILFIDRITPLKRNIILRKLGKAQRLKAAG
ncbi:MAG: peptide deformylase [Proteobacteria bacterium]|nr:peptide deformylase [Pseudomonadota bacterium]